LALVVLESTSNWFNRAIDSLRSVGAVEKESSPSTTETDPQGLITPDCAEFAVSAINYSAIKKTEEEPTPPPPRKKKALLDHKERRISYEARKYPPSITVETCYIRGRFR